MTSLKTRRSSAAPHHTRRVLVAAALLLAPCAASLAAELSSVEKDRLAARIAALRDGRGPQADAQRRSIPVPMYGIDVETTTTLANALSTLPGVPGVAQQNPLDQVDLDGLESAEPSGPDAAYTRPARLRNKGGIELQTIFGPDNRYAFWDHSYPYRTVGRVDIGGHCSGTMVGPRHLLTASHCIVWNADGTTGWLQFRPSLFGTSAPYGDAWAVSVYYYKKNTGPFLNGTDIAFDFVVVLLDRRIGDTVGWMGSQTYSTSWNNGAYWSNIGYPQDIGGGTWSIYQGGCSIFATWTAAFASWTSMGMYSYCDIIPGQSGSPLYAYWGGLPHVVAVTSAESASSNYWGGGSLLPSLINYVRSVAP